MASHDLESLSGIGPTTARTLAAAGFVDREAIASATVEQLVAVKGFAEARASALISEAQRRDEIGAPTASEGQGEPQDERSVVSATEPPKRSSKQRRKLRARHADLKKRAKKARKKSKSASSKKKRKWWAAEAERLAKKAEKAKKRLARLG
jgi:Holliday junction resolvasome RuvABC DNA-binding subunit